MFFPSLFSCQYDFKGMISLMGDDARSNSDSRYTRLLQLLSKYIPSLCFSCSGDPDTVFSLFIEPWFHASALAKSSSQTRLDAVEHELSGLQQLLGNIQAEFMLHLSQQRCQVIIVLPVWELGPCIHDPCSLLGPCNHAFIVFGTMP